MVDPVSRCENDVVVTVLTNVACLNMCRILPDGINAVVAVKATTSDTDMVKIGWYASV